MVGSVCPMFENCKIFASLSEREKEEIVKRYCKANFKSCARKKLKDQEKLVPRNLFPDGTIR